MSMILSRKPQLDQIQLSDNDYVETPIKETIRLNKFIANSGICSRREADQYIQAGVVTVNGEVVTELGSKVNVLNLVIVRAVVWHVNKFVCTISFIHVKCQF